MSGLGNTISPTFGPKKPTRLDLMGIRFMVPPENDNGGGGNYTPPADQDALNAIIQERVARALKPYEALKGLDVGDVAARYTATKDLDIDDLKAAKAELATVKASQGADLNDLNARLAAAETAKTALETDRSTKDGTIASLESQLLRYQVAADNQLPLSHAVRLVGTTKDELDADAKEYRKTLRTNGYDPGQGQQENDRQVGSEGVAEAERRFGKNT